MHQSETEVQEPQPSNSYLDETLPLMPETADEVAAYTNPLRWYREMGE